MTRLFKGAAPLALWIILGLPILATGTDPAAAASRSSAGTQLAAVELSKAGPSAEDPGGPSGTKNAIDDDAGCYRARKRLWVEGEGWIVRRVTTCR